MAKGTSKKTGKAAIGRAERARDALEHRKRGLSYRQIAREMRISSALAHVYVKEALAELASLKMEDAEAVRDLELERLDATLARCWQVLSEDGDPDVVLRAADRVVRVSKRRSEPLGLDAPVKGEQTVDVRGTVGPDLSSLSVDDLRELARILGGGEQ